MLSRSCRGARLYGFTGLLRGPIAAGDTLGTKHAALARSDAPALPRSSWTLRSPVAMMHSAPDALSVAPLCETRAWGYGADCWGPCSPRSCGGWQVKWWLWVVAGHMVS